MMSKIRQLLLRFMPVLVVALALVLRLPGIGSVMTADEPNWMERSAIFWHELFREKDPSGTFLSTHPGATTMWLAGAGAVWQESRLHVDVDSSTLRHFRKVMVMPITVTASVLIGLATWLLQRLWSKETGALAGVFLAIDPYLLGMSQVVHLDALLSLFMLASVLSFLLYVRAGGTRWLVLAGIAGGLALGEKMVLAAWLPPVFGAIAAWSWWQGRLSRRGAVMGVVAAAGIMLTMLAVLWPAMTVRKDLQMGYIARDTKTVITDEHVALSSAEQPISPWTFYGRTLLARTTPLVLGLILLAAGLAVWERRREGAVVIWLLLYALGYALLITLAAKKGDRYLLPALVVLPVAAGWALGQAGQRIARLHAGLSAALVAAAIGGAIAVTSAWTPQAVAYNNSLFDVRPLNQQGWGEGLELAAAWLNQHPLGERLTVASWYPEVLATYFKGKVFSLSSRNDYRVGYIVTYRNMGGREPDSQASNVLDELKDKMPVHVVMLQGKPYAWIYETMSVGYFTKHIGPLHGTMEVGQTVEPVVNRWDRIAVGFATFSGRHNTQDVILHVRESAEAAEDLRTVRVNATQIVDNEWHEFKFEPIQGAKGKTFFVSLESPSSTPTDAVTVRYIDEDIMPGEMYLRKQAGAALEKKPGDIAYKMPER